MSCKKKAQIMKKALRASSLILLTALTLSACGGGNSTAGPAPNAGNIPNLAVRPSTQASALKKVRLTGTIFNSYTGNPVENAEITIQVLSAASSTTGAPTPPPSGSTPAPIPTAPPSAGPMTSTPFPSLGPTPTPAVGSTPVPGPSPVPSSQPTLPPPGINPGDLPPADGPVAPGASLPQNLPQSLARTEVFSAYGAAFQIAQLASPSPTASDAPNVFTTDANNRGKFSMNDVPEGRMVVTVTAPGYRTLTLTEVNPTGLEVPLTPLDGGKVINVVGMVFSATDKPVADAIVSPSFVQGEGVGVSATTNELGEFVLPGVTFGTHSLVAFVLDDEQRIKQMGVLASVPISDKTLKVTKPALPNGDTPAPTPKPSVTSPEELLNNVEQILTDESPSPKASPTAKTSPKPSPKPSPEDSSEPGVAPSADPDPESSPAASPKPAASSSPGSSSMPVFEENQEEEEKGSNLFETITNGITELVTGEKPQGSTSDTEIYPVIPLRSVLSDVMLAGTVDVPEGYKAGNIDVYLTLAPAKKDDPPQDVHLYSLPLRAVAAAEPASTLAAATPSPAASPAAPQSVRFRVQLPNLEKGQTYHLQLTASKEEGSERSYNHVYNLTKSNEELKIQFMPATPKIEIEGEDVNAVPPVPGFGWSAVTGAELYHVSLEEGSGDDARVVWEAWTKETQIKYPLSSRSQRLRERRNYTVSVEALKGLRPATNDQKKQYALPAYRAIWTDLSRVTHVPFEVVE